MKPKVSVIVVNWNGGEIFVNCLESLKKISYENWELIVVDNASTDGSNNIKGFKNLKTIQNKTNVGFAPANNQGFEISKGKYILLLNNDTLVPPNLLDAFVKKMQMDESIGVMQQKIYLMNKK